MNVKPDLHVVHNEERMVLFLEQQATLGEGLTWKGSDQTWWWTDIESSTLQCWSPQSDALTVYRMPDRVGCYAHCVSGRLLVGMAKWLGFSSVNSELQSVAGQIELPVQPVAAVDPAEARTRVNDGRTDRSGNFVFGTMNEAQDKRPVGSFYQYSMRHGLRRLALPAVAIANSICFSPDGRTMYFTDTLERKIMQCDYDADSAQIDRIRLFVDVAQSDGPGIAPAYPDGSVVDRAGCVWNAQWGGSAVVQYGPDGLQRRRIAVPVLNPTCPAFGGANLDLLMVTTARQEMTSEQLLAMPASGSVFGIALTEPTGLPDAPFNDQLPDNASAPDLTKNNQYVKMRR